MAFSSIFETCAKVKIVEKIRQIVKKIRLFIIKMIIYGILIGYTLLGFIYALVVFLLLPFISTCLSYHIHSTLLYAISEIKSTARKKHPSGGCALSAKLQFESRHLTTAACVYSLWKMGFLSSKVQT